MLGLLGVTLARDEGVEINLLGLSFGVDFMNPALKLPFVGRLGLVQPRPGAATDDSPPLAEP
jgi:hypothetical protein